MSVNVNTGELIIGGNEGGTQGGYYARVTSQTNLSISAANPSNPRIDLVCATVSDSAYTEPTGGSGNQWAAQVVTGTATAGATLSNLLGVGSLPGSSLPLGYVLVPAAASNIITADILNAAVMATDALPGFAYVNGSSSLTARNGQWIEAAAGVTVTLPSAAAGTAIAITAKTGTSGSSPVTVSGSSIYGVGLSAASSFRLGTPGASVILQADGANWYIAAGQQDTGWLALTPASGVTSSGSYTAGARLQGDTVRLKGALLNGNGTTVTTVATIASQVTPSGTVTLPATTAPGTTDVQVTTGGVLSVPPGLAAAASVALDGITYTIS